MSCEQVAHEKAYGTNTSALPERVLNPEVVVNGIQWVNGVVDAAKVERDVDVLATGHHPPLFASVVVSPLNATINSIGNLARNLRKRKPVHGYADECDRKTVWRAYPLSKTATYCPLGARATRDFCLTAEPSGPIMPLSSSVSACQCWSGYP